jgi:hypothetical protein
MMLGLSYSRVAASTGGTVDEDRKYITDAQVEVLENTSGTNTGDKCN